MKKLKHNLIDSPTWQVSINLDMITSIKSNIKNAKEWYQLGRDKKQAFELLDSLIRESEDLKYKRPVLKRIRVRAYKLKTYSILINFVGIRMKHETEKLFKNVEQLELLLRYLATLDDLYLPIPESSYTLGYIFELCRWFIMKCGFYLRRIQIYTGFIDVTSVFGNRTRKFILSMVGNGEFCPHCNIQLLRGDIYCLRYSVLVEKLQDNLILLPCGHIYHLQCAFQSGGIEYREFLSKLLTNQEI